MTSNSTVSRAAGRNDLCDADERAAQIAVATEAIEAICYQSNFVALNTTVQALYAGAAGRTFSAVAVEVRSLAQRSADVAGLLKALLPDDAPVAEHTAVPACVQRAGNLPEVSGERETGNAEVVCPDGTTTTDRVSSAQSRNVSGLIGFFTARDV